MWCEAHCAISYRADKWMSMIKGSDPITQLLLACNIYVMGSDPITQLLLACNMYVKGSDPCLQTPVFSETGSFCIIISVEIEALP